MVKAKIQSQNIREQLKRLLESREPTEKWELFDAEGYQYLIRVVSNFLPISNARL